MTFASLPSWLLTAYALILGLCVGSFLNVVVARLPHGKSLVRPPSACPQCGRNIRWYENIPVLSFLALRGRCRGCRTAISVRYPVIELLVGMLFLATAARFGWSWLLVLRDWPFVALLVAISFIDLEHRIIPDSLSLSGLVIGLATAWAVPGLGEMNALLGAALGFGAFYLLSYLYQRFTGRMGLGGGDVKLLAMIGAFVGPSGVFLTIFISSISGSLIGIGWALSQSRGKPGVGPRAALMTVAIPYGPFLVLGALYAYLLGDLTWFQFTTPM